MTQSLSHGITLRPAQRSDARLIRGLTWQVGNNPLALDWRRFWLVVDADDRMLACAQFKPHSDGTREFASLAVIPEWRGRGLARSLILHFQEQDGPPLYLTCRSSLEALYTHFGFRSLTDDELPPYYLRLRRVTDILLKWTRRKEGICIMCWTG